MASTDCAGERLAMLTLFLLTKPPLSRVARLLLSNLNGLSLLFIQAVPLFLLFLCAAYVDRHCKQA